MRSHRAKVVAKIGAIRQEKAKESGKVLAKEIQEHSRSRYQTGNMLRSIQPGEATPDGVQVGSDLLYTKFQNSGFTHWISREFIEGAFFFENGAAAATPALRRIWMGGD